MAHYIDKDVVLAIIENRIRACGNCYILDELTSLHRTFDTIEATEVDLEKAIDDYIYTHDGRKRLALELDWKYCDLTLKGGNEIIKFAKHFFELGANASNPLTLEDISTIRQIMFDYNKQIRNEMTIPNDKEYCEEVLKRFKEIKKVD